MVAVGYSVCDLGAVKGSSRTPRLAPRGGKQGATVMTLYRDPDTHKLFTGDEMQARFENDLLGLIR